MTRQIARHKFDAKPEALRMNIGIRDEALASAFASETIPFGNLDGIIQRAITALPMRAFLDPKDPAILEDLRRIAKAAAGIFAAVDVPAGTEVSFDGHRTVSEGPKPAVAHNPTWERGFYAALAAREREATEILSRVTIPVLRNGQVKSEACFYTMVDALQSLAMKRAGAGEK